MTVGVRPVTDTVKELHDGHVGATHDRAGLLQVVSPVVLPAAVVAALDGVPTTDFAELVAALAERFPVETLEAPAEARRVADDADLRVLEALTAPRRAPTARSRGWPAGRRTARGAHGAADVRRPLGERQLRRAAEVASAPQSA